MSSPALPASPRVGIVTVGYASDSVLAVLLDSIPASVDEPVETVVVDNLPTRGEAERIATERGAHYIPLPENPGYGGAMNVGVASLPSSVEWVLLSNPDIELGAGSVSRLLAYARQDATAGSVGPLVANPDGTTYPSARAIPSLRTGVGHAMLGPVWPGNPWTRAYRTESEETPSVRAAGWLSGSCLLVRRQTFEQIDGFDDGYFMYFEDVDLGMRIGRAGYRNVYVPEARVVHIGGHSTQQASERMIHAHHESAKRFLSRKYPGPLLWPVRVALSTGLTVRSALVRRRSRRSSSGAA